MKSKFAAKTLATIKDLSPEIGVYGGTALMVGGGIWLAINTHKYLPDIIEEYEGELAQIESYIIDDEYTLQDKKKDIRDLRLYTAKRIVKALGLPTTLIVSGAVSNIAGFRVEKKNYQAAAAFGAATAKTLDTVINRIEKKYGEDGKRYALYGEEPVEIEDNETGEKKKIYKGSETDLAWPTSPYAMSVDMGHLYEHSGGNAVILCSELHDYEDLLNVQYNAGVPVYYYDILKYIFGNEVVKKLEQHGLLQKEVRDLGWYLRDPENRDRTEDGRAIDLRIDTWFGKVGDDDPYDKDKVWARINPNIPGPINLIVPTVKVRKTGGKYLSII